MFRRIAAALCSSWLVLAAPSARAGNNAGGSVELAWDAGALRSARSGFPLCVTVRDAPDLRQLAIRLGWSPRDPHGDCFRVTPVGRASACGSVGPRRAAAIQPGAAYTWAVLFEPAAPSPQYLVYWVTGSTCDSTAHPVFTVTDARALDSTGASDTLVARPTVARNGPPSMDPRADEARGGAAAEPLPTRLALHVHPNPAAGVVTIRFDLPAPMASHLALYDVRGALVRVADPAVRAQRGVFRWDLGDGGRRVRPGVYFARLTTPAGVRVAPVTVLR